MSGIYLLQFGVSHTPWVLKGAKMHQRGLLHADMAILSSKNLFTTSNHIYCYISTKNIQILQLKRIYIAHVERVSLLCRVIRVFDDLSVAKRPKRRWDLAWKDQAWR